MPNIVSFSQQTPDPVFDRPRSERLLTGNPLRTTWNHYDSAGGEFSCGLWQCEPGCWRIQFAPNKDEFFCVIEGRVRLHQEDGVTVDVGPGEAAVIPAGFTGKFEVIETVKKYYVIQERELAS